MSDDDSNDVVMVENTNDGSSAGEGPSENPETRPIMQLFQRLISNDNKQNTVLTNAQIIAILHKEFDIDIMSLHELELDIYLNIVKRFLKDWPKWDEFDQGINLLRKRNAYKSMKKTLEVKYTDLKEYLRIQLELTKPQAQENVSDVTKDQATRMKKVDTSEITLEVYCTRKQLNELILSQPVTGRVENTVFNLTEFKPTSITVNKLPIESILNWFSVQVTVDTKTLSYQRTTNHQLKHVLVNAKNGPRNLKRDLKTQLQMQDLRIPTTDMRKEKIYKIFDKLLNDESILRNNQALILQSLLEMIMNDMHEMDVLKFPGTYRQCSNKYPYYRKLKKDVQMGIPSPSYNLYVEETLEPMHIFNIGKPGIRQNRSRSDLVWLCVECLECKTKFTADDSEMYSLMREHFDVYHSNEPNWFCTNCEKDFSMTELARNKWLHYCS